MNHLINCLYAAITFCLTSKYPSALEQNLYSSHTVKDQVSNTQKQEELCIFILIFKI